MKNGLPIKSLQSLCDDFKQDIVDGPFGSELQRKDYITEGVPVLKIQNVKPFAIELKKMDYVSPAKFQELRRHSYRRGDIVMTKLGNPLGVSAIVEDLDEGVIVADLVRIRAQRINTKYLCYHLNSQRTNDFINSMQKGTTRPRVTLSVVRELPIFVPPPAVQKRIVGILDEAFEGIGTAKANAEKNLKSARALFESHLQSIFTRPGKGWAETTLDEVCQQITDGKHGDCKDEVGSGFYFLSAKDVKFGTLNYEKARQITKIDFEETHRRTNLEPGDILITNAGTIGRMAVAPSDDKTRRTTFQKSVAILKPVKDVIDSKFAFYCLSSGLTRFVKLSAGAAQKNLLLRDLRSYRFAMPRSIGQQRIVADKLESLSEKTQRLASLYERKLAALDALKKSLLHQAFTGNL
jgi:type I restriction enzyme S subunit